MSVTVGIWTVSEGKGERYYIKCNNEEKALHPDKLASGIGVGVYGFEHIQDLALAIIQFEQDQLIKNSVIGRLEELE